MLHYNPRHVSSSTMLIFRRTNCITTASGIVTLCFDGPIHPQIHMLRYNPQHVSSSTMLIFRRTNCITASGIVTLCKRPYSTPFTESDDTRGCNNTICPPEDEHSTARNMSRIIM